MKNFYLFMVIALSLSALPFSVQADDTSTNVALGATSSTSLCSSWESLTAINDGQVTPTSSTRLDAPYSKVYGNWDGSSGKTNWVEYDWTAPYTLDSLRVYWFSDGGGLLAPTSTEVQYDENGSWVSLGAIGSTLDVFNVMNVNQITTTKIRLSMASAVSTGISEFEVWGAKAQGIDLYKTMLQKLCQTVAGMTFDQIYPAGYGTKLNALKDEAETLIENSTSSEELMTKYDEMNAVYQECLASATVYTQLNDLDNQAYELLDKHKDYSGVADLTKVEAEAYALLKGQTEGFKADFEAMVTTLTAAIKVFRFSGASTPGTSIDASFVISNPDMESGKTIWTVTGGPTPNVISQDGYGGLTDDQNLFTGTYAYEMWTSSGVPITASFSQTITNLPSGMYTVTAAVSANDQASTGNLDGIYLFANDGLTPITVAQNVSSPALYSASTLVTNGTLKIGYKLVGSYANWCISDNYSLSYSSLSDADIMSSLIDKAKALVATPDNMLVSDRTALQTAITIAESATVDAASIAALTTAFDAANTAISAMATFKAGSYTTLNNLAANVNVSTELPEFITSKIENIDTALSASDATSDLYTSLKKDLAIYITYAKAQIATTAAINTYSTAATLLVDGQDSYDLLASAADTTQLKVYATELGEYVSFAQYYAENYAYSEKTTTYGAVSIETFVNTMKSILANVKSVSEFTPAKAEILNAVVALKASIAQNVNPGDEITANWIVNPTTEGTAGNVALNGWSIVPTNGNTYSGVGQHWSGDTARRYLDSWNGTTGKLQYLAQQSIIGLPNGTYKIQAAVRSSGAGAYLFAITGNDSLKVEMPNSGASAGGIWEAAEAGSEVKNANSGAGNGWNWIAIDNINVGANELVLGVTTQKAFTHITWGGTWFSATDFKLFYMGAAYTPVDHVGIDEVATDSEQLTVYAENGYIVVPGVEKFDVLTLGGMAVDAKSKLPAGLYIVKVGAKVTKIAVK